MSTKIFISLFSFIFFFTNAKSSEEDRIYRTPLGKISNNGPHHIYLTETEDWGGQLDNLADTYEYDIEGETATAKEWITLKEYANSLRLSEFSTHFIFSSASDHLFTNPVFIKVLNDFRNILKATRQNTAMIFDGDIRNDEAYISFNRIPETFSWDGSIKIASHALQRGQYTFAWKQDNNGRSYIASPIVLAELNRQCISIEIEKEDFGVDSLTSGFCNLELDSRKKNEIYNKYKDVSKKFLGKQKRRFLGSETHISLLDFTRDYLSLRQTTIDITNFSSRARIYLLTDIIRFKIPLKNKENRWRKERKTIISSGSPAREYAEWIDLLPTTFQIGSYSYKLENAATTQKPGGGRLYGLTRPDVAETYAQVATWLEAREANLIHFKTSLKKRLQGDKINLTYSNGEQKGKEATEINKFLNGLSLLFDFEVARRLVREDKFQELPVLAALPYLIDNFENIEIIKTCFSSFFSSEGRESFIKETIIPARKIYDTQKKIRDSMHIYHSASEDSGDEYESA